MLMHPDMNLEQELNWLVPEHAIPLSKRGKNQFRAFGNEDRQRLLREYRAHADNGTLDVLAAAMGRTKPFICRQAGTLGLTNQSRTRAYLSEVISASAKKRIAEKGHPRGMLGHKQTVEVKAAIGAASRARWAGMTKAEKEAVVDARLKTAAANGTHGAPRAGREKASWRAGWREVGGQRCYFRSAWEANYGRYLEWLREKGEIFAWAHEPETFWFEKIKRGVRSYKPDFRVTEIGGGIAYHEVKGWMDDRSKTCIARMRRYYPAVRLVVVDGRGYRAIRAKVAGIINGWETPEPREAGAANTQSALEPKVASANEPAEINTPAPRMIPARLGKRTVMVRADRVRA